MMGKKAIVIVSSLALCVCLWAVFSWPLPRHVLSGIPASSTNVEKDGVRRMLQGDHLQLHYFYWLFSDMLGGGTPLFRNLYEFNTGPESEQSRPGSYNMPFSLVYAAIRPWAGRAFAWNVAGFLGLWATHLLTLALLNRVSGRCRLNLFIALLGIALPYRWYTLCGGSPTGFAMVWIPALFLGLDMAGRDSTPVGSLVAAAALCLAYWNDLHVLFFGILFLPLPFLLGLLRSRHEDWRSARLSRYFVTLLPVVLVVATLGAVTSLTLTQRAAQAGLGAGRPAQEVQAFSAAARGLVRSRLIGQDAQVYLGWFLVCTGAASLVLFARRFALRQGEERRRALLGLLVWSALAAAVVLALGPNGPLDGRLFLAARRRIPGYGLIRQSGKAFVVAPTLIALAISLAARELRKISRSAMLNVFPPLIVVAVLVGDYALQVRTTVCLLDTSQQAYQAVATDCRRRGRPPRALVVPLWPGDSSWGSLYQHYVSIYRIRMLNGYRPIVPKRYTRDVVERFRSVNTGDLSSSQIDGLAAMGIRHLVFHENAFPEPVSPFPVFFTLKRLLEHPMLQLLRQDGNVWAFRMLAEPRDGPPPHVADANHHFPARQWQAESLPCPGGVVRVGVPGAGASGLVSLASGEAFLRIPAPDSVPIKRPVLHTRLCGEGTLEAVYSAPSGGEVSEMRPVAERSWTWLGIPLRKSDGSELRRLSCPSGQLDIDMAIMLTAPWAPPAEGTSQVFPACSFFNAGVIEPSSGALSFRPEYEADSVIFFGPRLPFEPDAYEVQIDYQTGVAAGTRLGSFVVGEGNRWSGPFEIRAGDEVRETIQVESNLPLTLRFTYSRNAPLVFRSVTFTRLASQ